MKISVGKTNVKFSPVNIKDVNKLGEMALQTNYSLSVFKDNYRNKTNFLSAEAIGLDIDDGLTLKEACSMFKDYKHVIMTTKSHQKDKNGLACDRFRVILFFDTEITEAKDYYATWGSLQDKYPFIDAACKDPSRYFYPSVTLVSTNPNGATVPIIKYVEPEKGDLDSYLVDTKGKGDLSRSTLKFFLEGASAGGRNMKLFKVAKDCQEQGYDRDEVVSLLQNMITSTGNWGSDEVNVKDLECIDNAFKNEPTYNKREVKKPSNNGFSLKTVSDIYKARDVNYIVDNLLTKGGLSIMAGPPKSGKSTLMRQLSKDFARGNEFFERKCKGGKVIYLALEEQEEGLKEQFCKNGINANDNMLFHVGPMPTEDVYRDLNALIEEQQPELVMIDTLAVFLGGAEFNDYSAMTVELTKLREIARKNDTHIMVLHHTNKNGTGSNAIMGSRAIHGAVDAALIMIQDGKRRFFDTSLRLGRNFNFNEIHYSEDTETYCLGLPKDDI